MPEQHIIDVPEVVDETFRVAMRSRIYHADLLEAAKKVGGVKMLAKELGINECTMSNWVLLKAFPALEIRCKDGRTRRNRKLAKRWPLISKRLFELTGKTTEQLFPGFVRLSGLLEMSKTAEVVKEISAGTMLGFQGAQAALPSPERLSDISFLKERLEKVLGTLTYREREVVKLRYGLGGGCCYSLDEVARIFKITRERVRQIEAKAIRKLQHPVRSGRIAEAAFDLLELHECPRCKQNVARFAHCDQCRAVVCYGCIGKHRNEKHPPADAGGRP